MFNIILIDITFNSNVKKYFIFKPFAIIINGENQKLIKIIT